MIDANKLKERFSTDGRCCDYYNLTRFLSGIDEIKPRGCKNPGILWGRRVIALGNSLKATLHDSNGKKTVDESKPGVRLVTIHRTDNQIIALQCAIAAFCYWEENIAKNLNRVFDKEVIESFDTTLLSYEFNRIKSPTLKKAAQDLLTTYLKDARDEALKQIDVEEHSLVTQIKNLEAAKEKEKVVAAPSRNLTQEVAEQKERTKLKQQILAAENAHRKQIQKEKRKEEAQQALRDQEQHRKDPVELKATEMVQPDQPKDKEQESHSSLSSTQKRNLKNKLRKQSRRQEMLKKKPSELPSPSGSSSPAASVAAAAPITPMTSDKPAEAASVLGQALVQPLPRSLPVAPEPSRNRYVFWEEFHRLSPLLRPDEKEVSLDSADQHQGMISEMKPARGEKAESLEEQFFQSQLHLSRERERNQELLKQLADKDRELHELRDRDERSKTLWADLSEQESRIEELEAQVKSLTGTAASATTPSPFKR